MHIFGFSEFSSLKMNCHCLNCNYRDIIFNINEDTELHRLVQCRNVKLSSVRKLLMTVNPNVRNSHYDTPLHLAVINENNYEIVTELMKAGAQVQVYNLSLNTPLHVAVLHRNRRATELLLQSGADVNSKNVLGNTPLHLVDKSPLYRRIGGSRLHEKLIVEKLILAGADVNLRNKFDETPLLRAVEAGDFDIVKELLKAGADANICNSDSTSCLHIALCKLHPDKKLLEELVENGANINCKDNWFRTPLDLAILNYFSNPSDRLKTAMALIRMAVLVHPDVSIDLSRIENKEAAVNSLYEFHQVCSSVVNKMKALRITEVISLYDFALRGMNCTVFSSNKLADKIYSNVLLALLKGTFDIYCDKIECHFPKLYLKKVLMNISIVANTGTNQTEIELSSDVVWLICDYLNQIDMFQLIKAVSNQKHIKLMIL